MKNRKRGVVTEETRKKLSIASSGKNNAMYGVRGKDHPGYGKPLTQEHKNKIIATKKINNAKKMKERLEAIKNRTEKKCSGCNKIKTLDMFYINRANLDGLGYICKKCDNKNRKARR